MQLILVNISELKWISSAHTFIISNNVLVETSNVPFVGWGDPLESGYHWAWPSEGCPGASWHCLSTVPGKHCSADNGSTVSPASPNPTLCGGKSGRKRKRWKDYFSCCYQLWRMEDVEKYSQVLEKLFARVRIISPAVDLGLDAAPAVAHLSHELWVLGQVYVTLVEGLRDLIVPVHCFSQVRLHSCQQVSF